MKVRALSTIILWDGKAGRSVIINAGEVGELPEHLADEQIEAGAAEPIDDEDHAEPDDEGVPALRKQYEALLGKRPFAGWDADELRRRMDDAAASSDKADDEDEIPPA